MRTCLLFLRKDKTGGHGFFRSWAVANVAKCLRRRRPSLISVLNRCSVLCLIIVSHSCVLPFIFM